MPVKSLVALEQYDLQDNTFLPQPVYGKKIIEMNHLCKLWYNL